MVRHLYPWWARRTCAVRKVPPPRLEPLEDRLVPATGNILVTGDVDGSYPAPQLLREFTPDGTLVFERTIPGNSSEGDYTDARDLIVAPDGKIHIFNGTFDPFLTTYDPATDSFSERTFSGWSTVNNLTYGGIAVLGDYVFVTDMRTFGDDGADEAKGIVRFNLADDTATRFVDTIEFRDLTMGLDGKLYALEDPNYFNLRVYDPLTLTLERTIGLPGIIIHEDELEDFRSVAVNANGDIFVSTLDGTIYRLDQDGNVQASISDTGGDIDVSTDGKLVGARSDGNVILMNQDFSNVTTFNTGTIYDFVAFADPQLPPPSLSIDDLSVTEGNAGKNAATFTVQLAFASDQTVTVDYATADGTATTGSDYQATSGTLTFDPGQTSQTITVYVNGDTVFEPNETFTVNLSNPVNANIRDGTGTGTILNDDLPPEFINEILVDPPGPDAPNQYVEIRGTPNQTLAEGTYLVAVEGDGSGDVQDIFDLSGLKFGSSGYLVLLQAGNSYSVAAGTTVLTGTTTGFGGLPDNRFSAAAVTDLPGGSESYLLMQAATAPALTDDIDANDDGTPDGAAYNSWIILDSIGILDGDAGDHSYAALTFRKGTDGIATGTVATVGFAAGYIGRNGDSTGSTETDWVAGADLQGTAPNFFLNNTDNPPSTAPTSYAGKPLDSLGGPNFVNVAPVNTVPDAQTTNEDTALIFSVMIGNALAVADVDAGTAPVKTRLTVTNGTLTLAGTANLIVSGNGSADVTITGSLAAINTALDGLRFDPTRDFNGTATLQIATNDQGNTGSAGAKTDTDTVSITVLPVNDAPSFTLLGNVTINEDAGAQPVAGFARNISGGPSDESGQHLAFSVTAHVTSGTLTFTSGPAIDPTTGDLTFTTAADSNGTATLDVTLKDDGGTDRGGIDTSPTRSFTLTVRAVNDAPLFDLAGNVTVDEDSGPKTVTNLATNFRPGPSTATDEAGQTLVRYNVAVLSTTGGLTFASGPAVDSDGTLTFQTTANAFGTATVQVTAVDSGPGTPPNVNSASKTFTLTVNPVNDAPDFTLSGDVTVNEDAGPQRIHGFARNISAGPGNESGQHLTFSVVAHVTSGTLTFTSGPAIDPTTGDLTFTTAADSNGTATLDVTLKDDGGTDRGGVDTSPTRSFTLTVRAVNDAPLFDLPGNVTVDEDSGPKTVTNLATNLRPGPSTATDEAGQTLVRYNVAVLSTTGDLTFTLGPAVDSNGTLTFQTTANAFGTATVQVTAVDSGPGTPPNVNSASKPFTLTVNPVNDAPDFTLSGDVTVNEDAGAQTVAGFARNISAGPGNESGQHLTFNVVAHITSGTLGFTSGPAIDPATGDLTFTTAADSNGTATLDVMLKDDGGTAGDGVDTSPTRSFTLTVRAVNDAPLFDLPGNVTVNEDAGSKTVTNFATNFRPGPATATDEAGQTLVRYDTVVLSTTGPLTFTAAPTVSADGTLTFTAAANAFGTAKVRVAAIDSGPGTPPDVNTGTRTFIVRVNPVNDPPTANNDAFVATQGRSKLLDVLSNDTSTPDAGESLTIVSATQGSVGGTVVIDGGTALRYTPHKSGGTERL